MALTKVKGSGVEGITNLSNATFLSVNASEVATLLTSAVINSEGGAVTTNIAQGVAKAWVNYKGPDTFAIRDSLNLSSMDDNGVGDHTMSILNDFSSVGYSMTATGYKPAAQHGFITNNNINFITAAVARIETVEHDGGHKHTEFEASCVTFHGDLA